MNAADRKELVSSLVGDFEQFIAAAVGEAEKAVQPAPPTLQVRYDAPAACLPEGLPAPRLQLRWSGSDGDYLCDYELVLGLSEIDIRNDAGTGHCVIELGRTKVGGSVAPWKAPEVRMRTPYRDGRHAAWDAKALGLPIYVLSPDGADLLPSADPVDRPSDDDLMVHLPESIRAENRCGIQRSAWLDGWFVPWSPRNENQNAEGPWSHWVALAHKILEADAKAAAALAAAGPEREA